MTSGEDGLRAHAVTEAAYASLRTGRVQKVAAFLTAETAIR
jgi:predicted dehydrogenase